MSKAAFYASVLVVVLPVNVACAQQNPYEELYLRSMEQMSSADRHSGARSGRSSAANYWLAAAAASKTCSQTLQHNCSHSCTTTRGCSSNCKVPD